MSREKMRTVIVHNRARCLECGEILESTHRHDFVQCSCGALAVDGGHAYLKRSLRPGAKMKELSECEDTPEDPDQEQPNEDWGSDP